MVFPMKIMGRIRCKQNGDFKKLDRVFKKAIEAEFEKIKVDRICITKDSIEFVGGLFRKVPPGRYA